ncbi:MAG TPA: GNAT family N-acetyltransferase [Myxococcales bacterium]|jgi:predicted GNAT family N-acyltransferase|nr:GNAT family N-acetyltransferase [Myxococcales bacterium]
MPAVRVRLADAAADRETCLRLRWTVFVEEQGVPPSLEQDEHDAPGAAAVHALAEVESPRGQPVPAGTGRFTWAAPGVAKIQRMAVIDDARGQGVGAQLLRFLEDEARKRGARRFTLDAQVAARGFYERAGYRASGGFFHDAGIPHVAMNREA